MRVGYKGIVEDRKMRKTIILVVTVLSWATVLSSGDEKPITVKGEVVCLTCYMKDGSEATGISHIGCAQACYKRGLPLAILDKGNSELYLPITTEFSKRGSKEETFVCSLVEHIPTRDQLEKYYGKNIIVTGVPFAGNGIMLMEIQTAVLEE